MLTAMESYHGKSTRHLSTHLFFHMDRNMHRKQDSHPSVSGFSSLCPEVGHARTVPERPARPPRTSRRSTETCKYQPSPSATGRRHFPTDFDEYFNLPPPVLPPDRHYREDHFSDLDYSHELDDIYSHRSAKSSPVVTSRDFRTTPLLHGSDPYSLDRLDHEDNNDDGSLFQDVPDDTAHWMPETHHPCSVRPKEVSINQLGSPVVKECVIIDLAENINAFDGSPLASLTVTSQLTRKAFELFRESHPECEGLLLMDVERTSQFPFVTYVVLKTSRNDLHRLVFHLETTVATQEHEQLHHIAGYEEVAAVDKCDDDIPHSTTSNVGFIISAFRVFPGEDREKLERHWLVWTGANLIYHRLPRHLGLTRITLHKKVYPERGINYVMVCECATLLDHVTEACVFVDHLRARCCGHTALYRIVEVF